MFVHYLKIALRNIRKYALQNAVSVIGLAAGFVCLCLSSVWLHYENSFDTFHRDADCIYTIGAKATGVKETHMVTAGNVSLISYSEALGATETTFFRFKEDEEKYREIQVDTAFCSFFDIKLLKGDWSFIGNTDGVALSAEYADKLFPGKDPIGQILDGRTVMAVVDGFSKPSVLKFDMMSYRKRVFNVNLSEVKSYGAMNYLLQSYCFMRFPKGSDPEKAFNALSSSKDSIITLNQQINSILNASDVLEPIIGLHERIIRDGSYVSYRTMYLFCAASALLMLCSIINMLIFFINVIRMRERESKLRMVHGSSAAGLLSMFVTEISMLVLIALLIGVAVVWISKDPFIALTDASMQSGFLIRSCLVEMILIFAVSVLICTISIKALKISDTSGKVFDGNNGNTFRKISLALQLFTGTTFIFVTCIMLKQFSFIRNQNWGLKINDQVVLTLHQKGMASLNDLNMDDEEAISRWSDMMNVDLLQKAEQQYGMSGKLKSLPAVTEVLDGTGDLFTYRLGKYSYETGTLNGIENCRYCTLDMLDDKGLRMFDLTLLDGSIPTDRPVNENEIVITENLSKHLGLGPVSEDPTITIESNVMTFNPVQFSKVTSDYHVIAVVKDIHAFSFGDEPDCIILCTPKNSKLASSSWMMDEFSKSDALYLLRYQRGSRDDLEKQVAGLLADMDMDYDLSFTEDKYFESLEKDKHLKNLILGLGIVCMLISIFGIWSMVSLACQERRREIAVRKVHGARVRDILLIFVNDYGKVIMASLLLAFITGYIIIHRWLQQFPRQTSVSWWIYAGIIVAMALVICMTVGHRVYKTARENPADVIKSE